MKLLRYKQVWVWLLVLFVLPACEDDVTNLKGLDVSPRLVVNSYISPQDTELKVQLQYTQPGVGKNKKPEELRIPDATVTMSDGNTSVVLTYDYITDTYLIDAARLPVVAGKTYFLKVSTPKGLKAEASCTVPSTAGITLTDLHHQATQPVENPNWFEHQFNYKWVDAPNVENYYRAMAYLVVKEPDANGQTQRMIQPFYLNDEELKSFSDDKLFSGATMKAPKFYTSSVPGMGRPGQIEYEVHALLLVADKHYYKYHHSFLNHSYSEDNPFAEPIFVYSNIQGGLGVFGAFNQIDTFITVR